MMFGFYSFDKFYLKKIEILNFFPNFKISKFEHYLFSVPDVDGSVLIKVILMMK